MGGEIINPLQKKEPLGVLASYTGVFFHLWGVIGPSPYQKDVLGLALKNFRETHVPGEILLEVNSRYITVDFLLENNFQIQKSVNRMLLTDFEGQHLKESSHFVMRAWHA